MGGRHVARQKGRLVVAAQAWRDSISVAVSDYLQKTDATYVSLAEFITNRLTERGYLAVQRDDLRLALAGMWNEEQDQPRREAIERLRAMCDEDEI